MSLSGEAVLYVTTPSDKIAQETARKERRRRKVIKELFDTEKTYLKHLDLINKFFDFPLRFACLVPEKVHATLFSNLEQIRQVNATLLETMEESTVGQAFKQLAPFLKLYSTYANNHQAALNALQEWQNKSPDFASFISKQEDKPEVMGLKLNALLITPIQRIPRYKLLLAELLSSTPDEHHDYKDLSDASNCIAEIAIHINECLRQNENFLKTLAIQKCFDSSAPKLLIPGRYFIKEGPLKKVSRKGGKSYERMFFLFSDILLYGKPKFLDGSKLYTCSCVLPLRHCKVEPVFITSLNKSDTGGVFRITCKEESFVLYSDDKKNAKEWSDEITRAVRKICDDRQTLRKPSSNKIPLRGRSLRKHRQQQKKLETKIPDKTPLRPLSVISSISDDYTCDSVASERADIMDHHMTSVFDLSTFDSFADTGCTSVVDSPVLRKKKCHQASPRRLPSTDDFYSETSERVKFRESQLSSESQNSEASTVMNSSLDKENDNTRKNCGNKRLHFHSSVTQTAIDKIASDSQYYSLSETETNTIRATKALSGHSISSSSTAWFPPNSPAHKHLQKKTLNMKLRSCFKRLCKSKKASSSVYSQSEKQSK